MAGCTNGCEDCAVHLGTTEAHLVINVPGCFIHPIPPPPPPAECNGIWKLDHATGKMRLVHEDGPCPKHP